MSEMMTIHEKIKETARLYYNTFEFNGYVLNESNKETQIKFATAAIELLLMELDFGYERMFWIEVVKEINTF
jgi:hypothetical protein